MSGPSTPVPPPPAAGPDAPAPWWRTSPARLVAVAAVPLLGALDERAGFVMLLIALVLLWRGDAWPTRGKVFGTVAAAALLGGVLPAQPRSGADPAASSEGTARPAVSAPAFGATVPATAPATPAVPVEKMTDFVGKRLDVAFSRSRKRGHEVRYHDASAEAREVSARSLWTVCFQTPAPGTVMTANGVVEFGAVRTGEPCPAREGGAVPWPRMPDLVGKTWPAARTAALALGVPEWRVRAEAAYLNDRLPDEGAYDDWRVCRQEPGEGSEVREDDGVTLSLSSPENGCPDPDRGHAVRLPDRDGDGDPDYRDPYPRDRNRDTSFPDGRPHYGGSDGSSGGGSDRGGWSPCRHTRWC
ncbi:Stk1 family PASTA domain-containing Ser/Thr kinase [Streptomyces termitum]|uniref:Stk1 family PASTA domain-containing Ser/Thr kinase n=1 Tax=Streptomyces termitum TaxID=67368 RepID=UPI0037AC9841